MTKVERARRVYDLDYFRGLDIESRAYRGDDENIKDILDNKVSLTFNDSQDRIVKAKYERHLSLAEQFSLGRLLLEEKLGGVLREIARDMFSGWGEHSNQAYESVKNDDGLFLVFYEGVTRLDNSEVGILRDSLRFSGEKVEFNISGLKEGEYRLFKKIYKEHGDLIEYIAGEEFEKLPNEMKDLLCISIPHPGNVWSVGHGNFHIGMFIFKSWASRGVRSATSEAKQ